MKLTIFNKKPLRNNYRGLKSKGFIKLNADYDMITFKLVGKDKDKDCPDIIQELKQLLKKFGYYTLNMHHLNRSHNHQKSYFMKETRFDENAKQDNRDN